MKWFCLSFLVMVSSQSIPAADEGPRSDEQHAVVTLPAASRKGEPTDNVVFTLPGPSLMGHTSPSLPMTEVHLVPPPADPDRPVLRRPQTQYPAEFERNSADFLNEKIGNWQQIDAQSLLGEPLRQRPAYADDQTVNGNIIAFLDPSGRFKEFELDFDRDTGLLRTLFVYPFSMTWQECRRSFGTNAKATQANKGRMFYSYTDRRLDVLVDGAGKVISLGMY